MGRMESFLASIWNYCVNLVATFTAAVLSHPKMQQAASDVIVLALNSALEQPELSNIIQQLTVRVYDDGAISRQMGEQFPKSAKQFVAGAFTSLRGYNKDRSNLKDESSSELAPAGKEAGENDDKKKEK
jgi:cation transport regulator ChaB